MMVASVKHKNRQIRQEALREQLAEQCRIQHIIDNIEKLESATDDMSQMQMQGIKAANEQRLKLLAKYLPDTKEIQIDSVNIQMNHMMGFDKPDA